jgi:hypothetical protein
MLQTEPPIGPRRLTATRSRKAARKLTPRRLTKPLIPLLSARAPAFRTRIRRRHRLKIPFSHGGDYGGGKVVGQGLANGNCRTVSEAI